MTRSVAPARRAPALFAALGLFAAACSTNPATGERMLSLMSPEQEKQIGAEAHPQLVRQFGGAYENQEIQRYVDGIGQLLAKTSEMPELKFTFTVLDSDIVNAMALPGGYISISRGLMALANNEAELASVVAHEIGHVTARHAAQRQTTAAVAGIGSVLAGVLLGQVGAQAAQGLGAVGLAQYSQSQEFEADTLGIRYLRRAGYDPEASADFLESLRAHSALEAQLAGLPPDQVDATNIMASHPRTLDRVRRAMEAAGEGGPVKNPMDGRDVYLRKLHGMIYGDSPEQGFARGNRFLHPALRFAFEVPDGYRLMNRPSQVLARGPNGAQIVFDMAKHSGEGMANYLAGAWGRSLRLQNVEPLTVNGMGGATAAARVNTNAGVRDLRLVAIDFGGGQAARFMFLTPPQMTGALADGLKRTTYSFRRLSASEAAAIKPLRIQVVRVRPGDSIDSLASRMALPDRKVERFRVLNGLTDGEGLRTGQLVKLVVEGDVPQQAS